MRPTLHGDARLVSENPVRVKTPATAWSYAASFPVEGQSERPMVAELDMQVAAGSIGVSFVDPQGQNLRHEVIVGPSDGRCRVQQVVEPGETGLVMIRTGPANGVCEVEIGALGLRPLTVDEQEAVERPVVLEPVERWNAFYGNYARSIPEQCRSLRYERLQVETAHPWTGGLSLLVAPHEQISRAAYVSGLYEPATALLLRSWLRSGATFLDIGANIGLFTLLGSRWVDDTGRVIAVEPSPRERRRLVAHLAVNAVRNVEVIAAAVAEQEGTGQLLVATSQHSGLNTMAKAFAYSGVNASETVIVPTVTIDALVRREALKQVDVIKLDVEGAECAALTGATTTLRRFRPRLMIEIFERALESCGASLRAVEQLLSSADYRLFEVSDRADLNPVSDLRGVRDHMVAAIPRESAGDADS